MNEEEIQALIKQLKAQGLSEEEIMATFYETFEKGDMDRKDLETLANAMGYELTDDFKNEPTPDPIEANGAEGMSKEDLEAAKEIAPNETKEEFQEKLEGGEGEEPKAEEEKSEAEGEKEEQPEAEPTETEDEDKGEDAHADEGEEEPSEDEEWEEAQKLFKINN
jgi:hypothetical protein